MQKFLIALLIIFSNSLWASSQLTLLVALDSKKLPENYVESLKNTMHAKLKHIKFNIVSDATIIDVSRELKNPDNLGVFLVAHSSEDEKVPGLESGLVIDSLHNKMNDVLKTVHGNLKFLSIIGCKSEALLNQYQKRYFPKTQVFGFKEIVEARDKTLYAKKSNGLSKSIEAFLKTQIDDQNSLRLPNFEQSLKNFELVKLTINRNKDADSSKVPFLQIKSGEEVLLILSPDQDHVQFEVEKSKLKKILVIENISLNKSFQVDLNQLLTMDLNDRPLSPVTFKSGKAIGVNRLLFQVENSISID